MRIAIYDNSLYISKQLVYLLKKYEEIKKICFSINSFHGNEVILSNNPNAKFIRIFISLISVFHNGKTCSP